LCRELEDAAAARQIMQEEMLQLQREELCRVMKDEVSNYKSSFILVSLFCSWWGWAVVINVTITRMFYSGVNITDMLK